MKENELYKNLINDFAYSPTPDQTTALKHLSKFLINENNEQIFLLKGYAGTGKTTIISTVVKNLSKLKLKASLMAPTGRAAKVMSNYSNRPAQTMHKRIYFPQKNNKGGVNFVQKENKFKNTVFIVDEASMIPDFSSGDDLFSGNSLLDDLIEFVFSGENCRLILIGDTAQLPPVKAELSPALDQDILSTKFHTEVIHIELTKVVRQQLDSGILRNATNMRNGLQNEFPEQFQFNLKQQNDLVRLIDGYEIMDAINTAYESDGHEETAIVVRSNKRANQYNQQIRQKILMREGEIAVGDFLMVVKNNYFWVKPTSQAGFIANGDIIEILKIRGIFDLYGFRFAKIKAQMVDYPEMNAFETVIILDTLEMNTPSLPFEESQKLYQEVLKDYADIKSKYKQFLKVKNNEFFNALQVKFSYAMTCHKSQGGQWNTVFVEQPYMPEGLDQNSLRWLYTACTRAKTKLYLIGFQNQFFKE
ncbi:ATP-dependent RecD-like DNA helicase [Flavobacterium sp. CS20]|jgi:exodeoxyribonuclease-5|uniref:ATP-dependent DNA helicase n=1 Tax=Flavobacterium sp. CS20 TaxID=2775246 RepID=UPI001B3A6DD3|nr:AAA family ATPase [Flavobacterium sp. CS20]QTY27368.1 AAA family ATPase [Flavobacterium sp. CS20]